MIIVITSYSIHYTKLYESTTGLCWATFVAAGIAGMDFGKFVKFSILGGIVWSGFLVAMGYFYGYLWREVSNYIDWVGWIIGVVAVLTYVFIPRFSSAFPSD